MSELPSRPAAGRHAPDDDAIASEDTSEVSRLFQERLQAWKHACGYIEDYISTTVRMQEANSKEYEKIIKVVSQPLREGEHFDSQPSGVAGMFDSLRSNTQGIANSQMDCSKQLKTTVLPVFERLHQEVKNKNKELTKGVGKGAKNVEKARALTQKHIEQLGQAVAAHDTAGHTNKGEPSSDPYVLHRGTIHRLNKQINEENANRQDMLSVQENFAQFETHIVQVFQQGFSSFLQAMSSNLDNNKVLLHNMIEHPQNMYPAYEWTKFVQRKSDVLIDPAAQPRSLSTATFANQEHPSTEPLIRGGLERKQGVLRKFESNFCVVTPAGFLHQYKTDDNLQKDPFPELSLYLPECIVGSLSENLFSVKGKDVSGGKFSVAQNKEQHFRARTNEDAETWYRVIMSLVGQKPTQVSAEPASPPSNQSPKVSALERSGTTHSGSRVVSGASASGAATAGSTPAVTSPSAEHAPQVAGSVDQTTESEIGKASTTAEPAQTQFR